MGSPVAITFRTIVFIGLTYFIIKQVDRYMKNEDAPFFSYKRFLSTPMDPYPVFTFCFEEGKGVYDEEYLSDFGFTENDYQSFLSGNDLIDETNQTKFNRIDFDEALIRFEDIVTKYMIIGQDASGGGAMVSWMAATANKNKSIFPPMYKSYQDPQKLCFTRNNSWGPQGVRSHEYIYMNKTLLKEMSGKLRIYHHQTDQLQKRICKYIISKEIEEIDFQMLEFWVSQVNVLRKRVDANEICDPNVIDDLAVLETTIKQINCTPPFWKSMLPENNSFPTCNSPTQLKHVSDILKAPDKLMGIFNQYIGPCIKLSSIVTFQEKAKNKEKDPESFVLVFNYLEEMYQEIRNERDFNLEMFWSSVGGFIGMFLGYSLWQCPEMMFTCKFLRKRKTSKKILGIK